MCVPETMNLANKTIQLINNQHFIRVLKIAFFIYSVLNCKIMRVTIKQNGNLELTPETELENYALDKWYDGYTAKGKETLSVNLFVEDKGVCMVESASE